jgi:hypothetical protein
VVIRVGGFSWWECFGGAIFNVAQLMITNCTVAQNSAVGGTG